MRKHRLFYTICGWVGIIVIIIAIGVLSIGIWFLTSTVNKNNHFVKTEATVVDIAEIRLQDSRGGKKTRYTEVVEYEVTGKKYRAQNNAYSTVTKDIGEKLVIYYNPANPEEYMFPSSNYPAAIVVFVLGICFIIVGIVLLRLEIKERKNINSTE